ncbi:VOC family protein [Emticicia sp. 21SJ11W-3]|uniref:VOC family protein n=1 Tax=Emticicia sp. 21SJ11W-3 TaxID=2916755 RepID=UPI00209ED9B1|nr:VOC family protein [Emticicia sp. 21SJ11W-3]UTA66444.1 VOC family protein [Emticicia sp. 21SJ11W-3]
MKVDWVFINAASRLEKIINKISGKLTAEAINMMAMQKTITFLMFVGEQYGKAEEAIRFYVSLFKHSAHRTL